MKRALTIIAALAAGVALMAARPGTEQQLIQQLNGQPTRWVLPDGGRSGVFTEFDGGVGNNFGCMSLTGGKAVINGTLQNVTPNVLVMVALTPSNVCLRPSVSSTVWDGGCNTNPRDENYGVPMPVGVPQYETPDSRATALCVVSDAGIVNFPVWWAQ